MLVDASRSKLHGEKLAESPLQEFGSSNTALGWHIYSARGSAGLAKPPLLPHPLSTADVHCPNQRSPRARPILPLAGLQTWPQLCGLGQTDVSLMRYCLPTALCLQGWLRGSATPNCCAFLTFAAVASWCYCLAAWPIGNPGQVPVSTKQLAARPNAGKGEQDREGKEGIFERRRKVFSF